MPFPAESTALAWKHSVSVQFRRGFVLQPELLMSGFNRIALRFPVTVLMVSVPAVAWPDLAVTVAVAEVIRLTEALPNLSVRIGMFAAFTGLDALPVYRNPAVLLNRTSWSGSGTPSSLATVATMSAVPQACVVLSRSMHF